MLRNLVSDIDVDQLVEDAGALNALTALMDEQVQCCRHPMPSTETVNQRHTCNALHHNRQPLAHVTLPQTSRWGVKIKFVRVQVCAASQSQPLFTRL